MLQKLIAIIFLGLLPIHSFSQSEESRYDVNDFLELTIDSVEIRSLYKSEPIDSNSFLVYFTVYNKSTDTINLTSYSCPSQHRYQLHTNHDNYIFNEDIYCNFSAPTNHVIAPQQSISLKETMFSSKSIQLKDNEDVQFIIPITNINHMSFNINSSENPKNQSELIYSGKLKIVFTHIKRGRR